MALYLKKVGNIFNIPINYYECDTELDLGSIDVTYITPCSEAFVIETGNIYVLNTSKQWKIKSSGNQGEINYVFDGGALSDPPGPTIVYDGGHI